MLELEKQRLKPWSLPENSWRNRQGEKTFLPASQLVFRPGAVLLTLLGFVSVCPVEPAGGGDRGWGPWMAVRGSWGAGTAEGGGKDEDELLFQRGLDLGGQR